MSYLPVALWARRTAVLAICAAVVVTMVEAPATAGASTAVPAATTSSAHPYSDPIWYPLHDAAQVGCVGTDAKNNGPTSGHNPCATDHPGYFGINLDISPSSKDGSGIFHYPDAGVYAMGAGRVQQVISGACTTSGQKSSGGTQVLINHGGGRVSVYQHLHAVNSAMKVGAYVAAGQQVGTAGNTGAPCFKSKGVPTPPYLDVIVRTDGGGYLQLSEPVATLHACKGATEQTLPKQMVTDQSGRLTPYDSWVITPYLKSVVPASSGACIPSGAPATTAAPTGVRAAPSNGRATVSWTAPRGADKFLVQMEIYRPSSRSWDAPCTPSQTSGCTVGYTEVDSRTATSYVQTGLLNGREYRFQVSAHNAFGWSVAGPSSWVQATPAGAPAAPGYRQLLGYPGEIELAWSMPTGNLNGSALHGYQVAISHRTSKGYTAWTYTNVGTTPHYLWTGTLAGTRYRVTVRARSSQGYSKFMPYKYRTTMTIPRPGLRSLSSSSRRISFGWSKPSAKGVTITDYETAIRRCTSSGCKAWVYKNRGVRFSTTWTGLRAGATYQVTVRARSRNGNSAYMTAHSIRVRG